jgi:excisionase family DNA binding protein
MSTKSVLFTTGEVAERLRVSTRTIANLVTRGHLQPVRIGDRVLFHQDEINRFSREGVRNTSADLLELDTYINTLEHGAPLHFVLTKYRDRANGAKHDAGDTKVADDMASKVGGLLLKMADKRKDAGEPLTVDERKALKFFCIALKALDEAQARA